MTTQGSLRQFLLKTAYDKTWHVNHDKPLIIVENSLSLQHHKSKQFHTEERPSQKHLLKNISWQIRLPLPNFSYSRIRHTRRGKGSPNLKIRSKNLLKRQRESTRIR